MRDYSVELGESVWVAVDGTSERALEWMELVDTAPGVKEWKSLG
jgi:hypothetical protein